MSVAETDVLRVAQKCPDWCHGADHSDCASDDGSVSHWTTVGEISPAGWEVVIEQQYAPSRDWTKIKLHGHEPETATAYLAVMSTSEARSVARLLIAAADLAEMQP